jgi:hypothetical protein
LESRQREFRRARQHVNTALMRLSNFMIHGNPPPGLGRLEETPKREEAPTVSAQA